MNGGRLGLGCAAGGAGDRDGAGRAVGSDGADARRVAAGGDSAMECTHCGIESTRPLSRRAMTCCSELHATCSAWFFERVNGNVGVLFNLYWKSVSRPRA